MSAPDFLALCRPGMVLKTRDRRDARILAVDAAGGVIRGEVQMMGPCAWLGDGRYKDAPAGASGPWDLMPPQPAERAAAERPRESLARALRRGDGNPGCCD
ncbi:MAG TPA: hypothetical protein VHA35_11745 [Dongiaceae bacterium]|jgi:hypothetical protein|nr:hypothetical protein [Dongiaceae bacterium]